MARAWYQVWSLENAQRTYFIKRERKQVTTHLHILLNPRYRRNCKDNAQCAKIDYSSPILATRPSRFQSLELGKNQVGQNHRPDRFSPEDPRIPFIPQLPNCQGTRESDILLASFAKRFLTASYQVIRLASRSGAILCQPQRRRTLKPNLSAINATNKQIWSKYSTSLRTECALSIVLSVMYP